jgi:hypothetical protein
MFASAYPVTSYIILEIQPMRSFQTHQFKQLVVSTALLAGTLIPGLAIQSHAFQANSPIQSVPSVSAIQSPTFTIAQTAALTGERQDEVKRKSYMKTTIQAELTVKPGLGRT